MINESADADFEKIDPEESLADSLIAFLRRDGKLPNLEGTTIFVTGRTGRDAHQVETVQEFWTKYFRETGADLRSYDYDAGPRLRQFLASHEPPPTH